MGESLNVLCVVFLEQIPVCSLEAVLQGLLSLSRPHLHSPGGSRLLVCYRLVHRCKVYRVVVGLAMGWEGRGAVCLPRIGTKQVQDFISSGSSFHTLCEAGQSFGERDMIEVLIIMRAVGCRVCSLATVEWMTAQALAATADGGTYTTTTMA